MTAASLGAVERLLSEIDEHAEEFTSHKDDLLITAGKLIRELAALTPAAGDDSWRAGWMACRREVFALCEATGDEAMPKPINDHAAGFERGRRHEAKGIARAMNAIDPPAAPPPADAVRALVGKWRAEANEPAFPDESDREAIEAEDAMLRRCADELERALSAAPAGECQTCKGHGFIPYQCGQTPESFEQGTYDCPDCTEPAAAPTPESGKIPQVLLDAHAEAVKWSPKSFAGADAIRAFQVLAGDYVCRLIDEAQQEGGR